MSTIRKYVDSSDSTRIVDALIELMGKDMTSKIAGAYTKSVDIPVEDVYGELKGGDFGKTLYEDGRAKSYKINVAHTPYWSKDNKKGISSRMVMEDPYMRKMGADKDWRLITYPKTTAEHEITHGMMSDIYGLNPKDTPFARTETVPYYIQALALRNYYPELIEKFGKDYGGSLKKRNERLIENLKNISKKEFKEFNK